MTPSGCLAAMSSHKPRITISLKHGMALISSRYCWANIGVPELSKVGQEVYLMKDEASSLM